MQPGILFITPYEIFNVTLVSFLVLLFVVYIVWVLGFFLKVSSQEIKIQA